jgi:hypothetical protein
MRNQLINSYAFNITQSLVMYKLQGRSAPTSNIPCLVQSAISKVQFHGFITMLEFHYGHDVEISSLPDSASRLVFLIQNIPSLACVCHNSYPRPHEHGLGAKRVMRTDETGTEVWWKERAHTRSATSRDGLDPIAPAARHHYGECDSSTMHCNHNTVKIYRLSCSSLVESVSSVSDFLIWSLAALSPLELDSSHHHH